MTPTDERLAAFLAEDDAPLSDPSFRIEVLERLERRRARRQLFLLALAAILGAVVLWSLAPMLAAWTVNFADLFAVMFTAAALVWGSIAAVRKGLRA